MTDGIEPVTWSGRQVVVTFPGRVGGLEAASQAELRLVIPALEVRHLIAADGLDRLVPVYSTLEGALAAGVPDEPEANDPAGHGTPATRLPEWGWEQAGRRQPPGGRGPRADQ